MENQKSDSTTPPLPPLFLVDKRCVALRRVLRSNLRQKFSRVTRSVDMSERIGEVEYVWFMASLVYEELLDLCLVSGSSEPFNAFMRTFQFLNESLREHNELQKRSPEKDGGENQSSPVGGPDIN